MNPNQEPTRNLVRNVLIRALIIKNPPMVMMLDVKGVIALNESKINIKIVMYINVLRFIVYFGF